MKKSISLIALLLSITFTFISCSMFDQKAEDDNASVSFEIPAELLRRIVARTDNFDEIGERKIIYIDVKLNGSYKESQTVTTSVPYDRMQDVPSQNENIQDKSVIESQIVTFKRVPVGSKIKAEVLISSAYAFGNEVSVKQAIYKGRSESITVKRGENNLLVKLGHAYKQYPVSIAINFSGSQIPESIGSCNGIDVMAYGKDSDALRDYYNRFANGNGTQSDVDYLKEQSGSVDCAGYGYWTLNSNDNHCSVNGNTITITDDMNLMIDEELVFVAFINYGANNIYVGNRPVSSFEELNETAVTPSQSRTTVSMNAVKLSPEPLYSLYSYNSYNGSYDVYLTANVDNPYLENPYNVNTTKSAFDANGNWYGIRSNLESGAEIVSNTFDDVVTIDYSDDIHGSYGITIDTKNNIFYAYCINEATLDIYKYPNLISSKGNDVSRVSYTRSYGMMHYLIIVNNGICYDYVYEYFNDQPAYCLYQYSIPNTDGNIDTEININTEKKLITNKLFNDISNISISDMVYTDGYLYAIAKTNKSNASRGMLVKCNVSSGEVFTLGYVPDKTITNYKAGIEIRFNGSSNVIIQSTNLTDYYIRTFAEGELYAPYNNINSYFVGPEKFIAIKPKKLAISDAGMFFYTNDNGVLAKKKANRVVEIDLETLSMETATKTDIVNDFISSYSCEVYLESADTITLPEGLYKISGGSPVSISAGTASVLPRAIEE